MFTSAVLTKSRFIMLRQRRWLIWFLLSLAMAPTKAEHFTCVSLQYPPLIYQGASGATEGLAVDLVSAVFKRMGHTLTVEIYPWARSLAMMKMGEKDCIFTIFRSPEREAFLDFNQRSIIPQVVYLYANKNKVPHFDGELSELAQYHIGTVNQINYGPKFEQARKSLILEEAGSLEQNFKKLALGRVDLAPCNLYTAIYTLAQADLKLYAEKLTKLPIPVETVPSFIGFPKTRKQQALIAQFDIEFKKILHSGTYRKLLEKYDIEMTPELTQYLLRR